MDEKLVEEKNHGTGRDWFNLDGGHLFKILKLHEFSNNQIS